MAEQLRRSTLDRKTGGSNPAVDPFFCVVDLGYNLLFLFLFFSLRNERNDRKKMCDRDQVKRGGGGELIHYRP